MGCQCQKPDFLNDELTADEKKQIKNIEGDNDYLSNNYYNIKSRKYINPNGKPIDEFSKYIFNKINSIRENPQSFIDIIQKSKKNIKMDKSGIKIYKSSIKVALNRGEDAFDDASCVGVFAADDGFAAHVVAGFAYHGVEAKVANVDAIAVVGLYVG